MADGSVTINTKMDTSGVEKGADDIVQSLKNILGYMQNISSNVEKLVTNLTRGSNAAGKAVSNLTDNLEATAEAGKRAVKEISKFDPSDVSGLTIHRWNDDSNLIGDTSEISEEERKELRENAKAAIEAAQEEAEAYNTAKEEVNEYYQAIKTLKDELKSLEKSGKFWGSDEYDETAIKLNEVIKKVQEYKKATLAPEIDSTANSVSRLGEKVGKLSQKLMSSGISGLKNKIKSIAKTIDKLVSKLLTLTSGAILGGLQRISSGIFAIHKSANKSTLSLKNLLKYAFGIRSLFALINRIRSAAVEGLQNLAKYDSLGNVNQSISSLISALTRLKNSFATAFAPILTAVAPILVRFINLISEAVTRVGMLIAALIGQKTFTRAIAVQENYAASLDKTADSAKKATKAVKGYLSPLDEMDRYESGSNDTGIGSSGGYTGPSAGDMFEEVPIANSLKGIADKIKKLIKDEDWEGLGAYMAEGINKGLEKVYNVINWDNVGPKITPFIKGFTETFNSLVDHIDWNLMGRTVGTGINTIVKSLNLAITGIDWFNLGKKFAQGVQGIITETNWNELGQLLGNRFMALWRVFGGFVKNLPYRSIGKAVAEGLNGVFKTISFPEISDYLTTAINGAFDSLDEFTRDFEWDEFAENVKNGITDFINGIEWEKNGKIFGDFLSELCDTLDGSIDENTFYKFGKGIGDFLGQLPWGKLLWTAGKMIIGGIKWSLQGLWESEGLPGKIAAIIGAAFAIVKIADITGIGSLVSLIIGHIGTKIAESKNAELIASKLSEVIGKGTEQATGALEGLGNAAETSGGQLGGFWSMAMNAGATAFVVQQFKDVKTAMDLEDSTTKAFDDFEVVRKALKSLEDQSVISGDKLIGLGGDLGSVKDNTFDFDQQFQTVITTLKNAGVSSDTFKEALKTALEDSNVSADENIKKINEYLGNMENKFDSSKTTAETKMSAVSTAVGTAMSGVQSATEKAMSAAERAVSDSTGNISTDSEINWAAAEGFATGSVEKVGETTYQNMKAVYGVVSRYNASIKDDFDTNWGDSQNTVINAIQGMADEIERNGDRLAIGVKNAFSGIPGYITDIMNNAVGRVNNAIGKINGALGNIERGFTFTYNYTNPVTKSRGTYRSWLNLGRVNTVPYLASGAVIPPRSEFLAVLGDQKNGKNLEAPEETIREIINDALAQNQGGGETRITIQLDRRTIYDSVIKEAKTRRDTTGKNPFDLI